MGPRRVMPGGAHRFPHLRKRVHRPGLRVSTARRRRRWFRFRKRKEVSPGSACRRERTRSPGPGHSSQPALLPPAASSVGLGLRLPFKFEFQRREPRACVGGGAGRASPRPRTGSRGRGGRVVPRTAPLPQPSGARVPRRVRCCGDRNRLGPKPRLQRSHTPPAPFPRAGLGVPLPAFLRAGLRAGFL